MLDRVANLLPVDASGLWGGTFHSIGNRMLRRHGSALGYSSGFTILDREDQKDLINTVVASAGIDPKEIRFPKGDVLAEIFSFVINTEHSMEEMLAEKFPYFLPLIEQIKDVHARYERKKKATNSLDFDDLLEKTLRMLKEHEHIAETYRRQFQFVLVDEYQDTNKIQADFIDTLASEHRNVMVVGDDAQSIYSWRGANFKNILEFPKRYPDAQVFKIELNYRSVPEILRVANAAIAQNVQQFRKNLSATRDSKNFRPALVALNDGGEQAVFIAQRILELRDEGIDLERHRGSVSRALSRGGIAARTFAPRHSLSDHERRAFFRAGTHQRRRVVHSLRCQSARRSCLQAHDQIAAGNREQERGQLMERVDRVARSERRDRFMAVRD